MNRKGWRSCEARIDFSCAAVCGEKNAKRCIRTMEREKGKKRKRKRQCREISARGRRSVGRGKTKKRRDGALGVERGGGNGCRERMTAGKSFKMKREKGVGIQGKWEDVL
jgi:hypothetical protein